RDDRAPGRARELEHGRRDRRRAADGRPADLLPVEPRAAGAGPAHADRQRAQALMAEGLPPVDTALLPADVREAGPQARRNYATALAFERVLTEELAQPLASTMSSGPGDGPDGDAPDAATSLAAQLVPEALSQSLAGSGGLGLARALYDALGGA